MTNGAAIVYSLLDPNAQGLIFLIKWSVYMYSHIYGPLPSFTLALVLKLRVNIFEYVLKTLLSPGGLAEI